MRLLGHILYSAAPAEVVAPCNSKFVLGIQAQGAKPVWPGWERAELQPSHVEPKDCLWIHPKKVPELAQVDVFGMAASGSSDLILFLSFGLPSFFVG